MTISLRYNSIPDAQDVPFDNATNGFISDNTQAAIEELNTSIATSASPGFSFGKSSNVNNGTWLLCESVPCNKAGRFVYISSAVITRVFVSSETITTFDISIYEHEGNSVNLTLLGTVSIINKRGDDFVVNIPITTKRQLALRVTSGSAKNVVAGLELQGTN